MALQEASKLLAPSRRIGHADEYFADGVEDGDLSSRHFVRVSAKGKVFRKVDFKYCIFDSCYMRNCAFDSCDFTGCRFTGTSFHGSTFSGCKFDYAGFERTLIDPGVLDACCPAFENLKMRFARTLRVNFQQLGDAKAANKAILVELAAEKTHLDKAWRSNEAYYRKKYAGLNRFLMFVRWLNFVWWDAVWGNGESATKLARTAGLVIVLVALGDALLRRNALLVSSYWHALLDSLLFLLGTKSAGYPGWVVVGGAVARLVLFGFFVSILVKRLSRR